MTTKCKYYYCLFSFSIFYSHLWNRDFYFLLCPASHSFPYIKKRVPVVYHKDEELSPVEVAVEDMKAKVIELNEVVNQPARDIKKLQLKLQGAVSVQVNAGPLAYAEAFLAADKRSKYRHDRIGALQEHFRLIALNPVFTFLILSNTRENQKTSR